MHHCRIYRFKEIYISSDRTLDRVLKPILSQEGNKMIFDFKNIEFIDSSGIGCIISLVKTAQKQSF